MAEPRVAWIFPGQGAQEAGMGRDLFESSPTARKVFENADNVLGYSLSQLCFEGPVERLQETQHAQPAIFVTSLACLEAAREQGSIDEPPAFVAGHSLGEFSAVVAAEALDFESGLRLVARRGILMQEAAEQNPGAMAAILGLEESALIDICETAGASICNLNAPGQIVIGGAEAAVAAAMATALERGAQRGVRLNVSGGFHTSLMEPAAEGMADAVANAPLRDPQVPIIANTSAEPLTTAGQLRSELVEQLTMPVQWQRSVEALKAAGVGTVIEFGPGRVLTGLVKRIDRSIGLRNVSDMAGARAPAAAPSPP
jgi:[acyl-carrier-protein] S-malonyltransferase